MSVDRDMNRTRNSWKTDHTYNTTPVTEKYLCVIIKASVSDLFIITAYFTDTIKRGMILWKRK